MMLPYTRDECWGTKEREACSCGGDESQCNFYPEKRKQSCKHFGRGLHHKCDPANYGTCRKVSDDCYCGGDTDKCTFGEVWKDRMNTAYMWIVAQKHGGTYVTNDLRYSKEKGFHDKEGRQWEPSSFETIEQIMQCEWDILKTMTRAEAERKYGIIIEG